MALTCSRLVSMESLGVYSLPSLTGLAAGGFFSLVTCLALVSFAFVSLVVSLALVVALAAGFAPAPAAGAASTLSFEAFAPVVAVSLSLRFSASELVKFLSKEEPFVTINF